MGNQTATKEQTDAYTAYTLLGAKKFIKERCQLAIQVREEELEQAGDNVGQVMKLSYLGYRMAIEDIYYGLYGEKLPEPAFTSSVVWDKLDV